MGSAKRTSSGNHLIDALPQGDRRRLLAGCDDEQLAESQVLFGAGERVHHARFPTTGYVSLLTPMDGAALLEVGLTGREGMAGTSLTAGIAESPLKAVVQGAGHAYRMEASALRRMLLSSPALKSLLDRYVFVRLTQVSRTAGCTRFHFVEARLARWLLMTQDRARSSRFHVTHEFLAIMLGVRRAGVTRAATALGARGLIRYRRGDVEILDRPGLKAASCACYQADRDTYRLALG
ncbi:MAG: Crp/Fnr family transcriptional regulator [Vicinamibacterales bacterium]